MDAYARNRTVNSEHGPAYPGAGVNYAKPVGKVLWAVVAVYVKRLEEEERIAGGEAAEVLVVVAGPVVVAADCSVKDPTCEAIDRVDLA